MTERTEVLFAPYVTVIANADGTHSVSIDWSDTCQGEVLRNADGVVLAASPSLDENPERVEKFAIGPTPFSFQRLTKSSPSSMPAENHSTEGITHA